MDSTEAKAYKIALMWEDECRRELPGESHVRLKRNSDPRKSLLFKYCFKLAREMSGILADNEISLYIRAQIQILKAIREGEIHALIEPHCLVGDKAWKRWKFWKYRYDKRLKVAPMSDEMNIRTSEGKIKAEIVSSFELLSKRGIDSAEEMKARKEELKSWIKNGEISHFYAVLSPWMRSSFDSMDDLGIDETYCSACITPSLDKFFREVFSHEFERKNATCQKV